MFKRQFAFTMAETLITLLIIGIISSIVIPAIVQDTQNAELKASWKKAYAEMEQATRQIMYDNAGTIKNICSNFSHTCLRNLYLSSFRYTKSCDIGYAMGNCWHNYGNFSYLSGTPITDVNQWASDHTAAILANGYLIDFWYQFKDCSGTSGSVKYCGYISVDINGFKKPNTFGKDIYSILLYETGIKPAGLSGDAYANSCNNSGSGIGCSAKYLYQ